MPSSNSRTTVCIIGAGPYGLAIAAHLRHAGIDFRIFGSPMRRWRDQMPNSMLLKSEGCASSLPDPSGQHSLSGYCREHGLPFAEYAAPVSREIFTNHALSFQNKLVPQVEDVSVVAVARLSEGFEVGLDNGETMRSAQVIIATGLDHMEHVPEPLRLLPDASWSHSADHRDLSKFRGQVVAVIGAGQSGLETAAILREEGATPTLLVRAPAIAWNRVPSATRRSLWQRLRRPRTRLGEGLQLWVYDNAPRLFHALPREVRLSRVKASLGPAGAWWLKDRVIGQMPVFVGHEVRSAEQRDGRVVLHVADANGRSDTLIADHVIAATGYRFDLQKLPFLDQTLKSKIRDEEGQPRLLSSFESSVAGLYFTGLGSANSFGPAMRFVAGTGYTARQIVSHIAKVRGLHAVSFAQQQRCLEA